MLDVALRCAKCGTLFATNVARGVPDLMAYCGTCARAIDRTIQKNMMAQTGIAFGSTRFDRQANGELTTTRIVRSDDG